MTTKRRDTVERDFTAPVKTKVCNRCGSEFIVGLAVIEEGRKTRSFYCMREGCVRVAIAKARNVRDDLLKQGHLCRFKPMHDDVCGYKGKPAVRNGLCAKHAEMSCSYPGCHRPVTRECWRSIQFECDKPVCDQHIACCPEHDEPKRADTHPPPDIPSS